MIGSREYPECGRLFRQYFGLELKGFMDMRMLLAFKALSLNIVKFGDWLDKRFPEDAKRDGVSYSDVVRKHFGENAEKLIKRMI